MPAGQSADQNDTDKPLSPVKTRGLHRTPLSGGVNATRRYDLPPPAVAARNLVCLAVELQVASHLRLTAGSFKRWGTRLAQEGRALALSAWRAEYQL